jgi:hypothetical protein
VMTFIVEARIRHRYIEPALAGVTARLPAEHAGFSIQPRR